MAYLISEEDQAITMEPGSESTPLLRSTNMSKEVGVSQQTLVSSTDAKARKLPQYVAGLSSTLGAMAAGMVLAWSSSAGNKGIELSRLYEVPMTSDEFSMISSIATLGAAAICVPIGILCDLIGRKLSMLILVLPFTVGWALIIWSGSVDMFYAGRFITGLSGGAFCVTAPMYSSEIAENEIRGQLGSFFQLMLTVGILLSYALGMGLNMFQLSLVSAVVPLVFLAVFIFMPETPIYYLQKGNIDAARDSLRRLRGDSYDIDLELRVQKELLDEAERNKVSFWGAIRTRATKKALLIGFGLMLFQQLSGVNAVIFFVGQIFADAGTGLDPKISAIIVGVIQVIAVFVSSLIVDRLGRRILLLVSSATMIVTTLALGIFFFLKDRGDDVNSILWLPLVSLCIFMILFSLGFGPIPWMMMGELFSSQVKGVAGSSACLFNWIMAFLVTNYFDAMNVAFKGKGPTFWLFSAICLLGFMFTLLLVPETKGKSLDQIQQELEGTDKT